MLTDMHFVLFVYYDGGKKNVCTYIGFTSSVVGSSLSFFFAEASDMSSGNFVSCL